MKYFSGKIYSFIFISLMIFIVSCRTEETIVSPVQPEGPRVLLSGRVIDQSGNGFRGAMVRIVETNNNVQTDYKGDFVIKSEALDSSVTIRPIKQDCEFEPSEYKLSVKKDTEDLNFTAIMFSSISGTVSLADGNPVEGVAIMNSFNVVYTDAMGKYTIDNIPLGNIVRVAAFKRNYTFSGAQKVKAVKGGAVNINFTAIRTDDLKIKTIADGDLTIYSINLFNTVIVKVPSISSYIMQTKSGSMKTVSETGTEGNYRVVVNSSFFDYDPKTLLYSHAGYLRIKDQILGTTKPNDMQIQGLLAYNSRENTAGIYDIKDSAETAGYDLVFQTGPRIVRDFGVDSMAIFYSYNGWAPAYRTVFAISGNKDFYIVITRDFATLDALAHLLIDSGIFYKGSLNAIDFDGGPSTCLYVKGHPEFNYNDSRRLPFLLGVK